jgi:replicative DNA helicase
MPQSMDAEQAVISCMLQDAPATLDLVFARIKSEEFFHYPPHRHIFSAMRGMRAETLASLIDVITVTSELERNGALEAVGGQNYLNELVGKVPSTANIDKYVEIVIDSQILRQMIRSCSDIVGRCYEADGEIEELIDNIEQEVLAVTELRTEKTAASIKDLITGGIKYLDALTRGEGQAVGVPTGYVDLDRLLTGLRPGEMFVLAARPSIGKTTLAMNIARNAAVESKVGVGFFSLEMSAQQVVVRLLCSEARINLKDVRDGKLTNAQWASDLMGAGDRLAAAPIYIDETPQLTSLELRQKARRMKQDYDIGVIIIDYLQLMKASGGNSTSSREQDVARLSSDIKALAKELNVPIVILAQLNRQAEQGGGRPKLSHLRESGSIEQDADVVGILHRERETDMNLTREEIDAQGIETELIIAKHRNGETGIVKLTFLGQFTRFENFSRYGAEEVPM